MPRIAYINRIFKGSSAALIEFRETNSDDEPIGPTCAASLSAIDAIVIY